MDRGRGVMSTTPLNLRQERHEPVSVLSVIKIETSIETSNIRMPHGDNRAISGLTEFTLKDYRNLKYSVYHIEIEATVFLSQNCSFNGLA